MLSQPAFNYQEQEDIAEYNRIKVGVKSLEDAVLMLGDLSKNTYGINKKSVLKALGDKDLAELRRISEYFYNTSGIYKRICDYFAYLYRYDWYIIPEVYDNSVKEDKIIKDYIKLLGFLDNSYIKKISGDIALKVIKYGCYYGYVVDNDDGIMIQELPIKYCRNRYNVNGIPAVEFNMSFFDEKFTDPAYRLKILKMFPEEFQKGYMLFKQNKLLEDDWVDVNLESQSNSTTGFGGNGSFKRSGWYLLEPGAVIKFNLNNSDTPVFASAIPSIIDLDAAQDLDRRKQMQQLLKIIIQKLPLDKNGDLIFDVDEARDIHNNAVQMLKRAVGVDVITTFADIDSVNMSDKTTTATQDDLAKIERTVYNAFGVSRNLFNTDGNLSLEKSILDDEATVRNLLLQFNIFFNNIVLKKNTNSKKYKFRFQMLETTQYNYKELSKLFKEQEQVGKSKMLSQIALGLPQSFILNTAYFENEILHLSEVMIPPLMSSTLNGQDILGNKGQSNSSNIQNNTGTKSAGRPEKEESEKSEKTIQNLESQS